MIAARSVLVVVVSIAAAAGTAAPARAQPSTVPPSAMPPPPPGPPTAGAAPARRVHRGIYLHADLGLVLPAFTSQDTFGSPPASMTGGGIGFGLAVGHSVRNNFIVHFAVFDHMVTNPTVTQGGVESTLENVSLDLVGVGVGATYYFMPINFYASATLVASRLRRREPVNGSLTETSSTDSGGGLSLAVGKEWYVARSTGIGVAAQLFVGGMTEEGTDPTEIDDVRWSAASLGLLFSATYD